VKVGESIHVEVLVSNNADTPILIANSVGTITGALARVQFRLTDSHGHVSPPVVTMIAAYRNEEVNSYCASDD
jgi:hypothetical protein